MGRLTLNILLSFAQFEREVIGERVHDKIAPSNGTQEYGSLLASAVASPAGAMPSMRAVTIRGDTKASGAR